MKKIAIGMLVCCALLKASAADLNWLTDVPKAEAQAKTESKLVLLDFTGSDWCGWCIKLDNDTFSKPEFADYAKKNLVLVQLDYPNKKPQSDDLKKSNAALQVKYNIEGFPTLIALKPDGTVVWKQVGYLAGGPAALIANLDEAKQK
ncbi:MAG TPA: thioredoxin family protein [Verrucomicrobiae bacterium]|jgi:protein disulfide-isomerase|nr:thioredoxin family protein [Verrucomicrobiae bacterium]